MKTLILFALIMSATYAYPQPVIECMIDASGSLVDATMTAAIHNVVIDLPELIEQTGATEITFWFFQDDSWNAQFVKRIQLPHREDYEVQDRHAHTLPIPALQIAVQQSAERERQDQILNYRRCLEDSLIGIEKHITPHMLGSDCTDLAGCFWRAKYMNSVCKSGILIIITDGAHTCTRALDPIGSTPSVEIFVVLTTEKIAPGSTPLAILPASIQFQERAKTIKCAIPQVIILSSILTNPISSHLED